MDPQIRDQRLLDALESVAQEPYEGIVWRSVKEGRDPLTCSRSGGRWDDGTFDVLYTSETRAAAIAERRYHLYQGATDSALRREFRAVRAECHSKRRYSLPWYEGFGPPWVSIRLPSDA